MERPFEDERTSKLREAFFSEGAGPDDPGVELLSSWKRSREALGSPDKVHTVPNVPEEMLDEHLLELFAPLMNRFAESVEGTGLALLLSDSRGQILQRWYEDRSAEAHLDRVGTVRGAVLAENVVGTNGVGTVIELGRPVQISGAQHFAEFYQDAICTGAPITHPVSGNLLAVVTISCDLTPGAEYLVPLLRSMTRDMNEHLLNMQSPEAREMLSVYMNLARNSQTPLLGFGAEGTMLQNTGAKDLAPEDVALLRDMPTATTETSTVVELSHGPTRVAFHPIGNTNRVVKIEGPGQERTSTHFSAPRGPGRLVGRTPEWLATVNQVSKLRASESPLILAGEFGTGKSSLAINAPFQLGESEATYQVVEAAEFNVIGGREWFDKVRSVLETGKPTLVRGVEALDANGLDGLRIVLAGRSGRDIVMTYTTDMPEDVEQLELHFDANSVWVPPLRERIGDLPELWQEFVSRLNPPATLEPTQQALHMLSAYDWPGNIRELSRLIRRLASSNNGGVVGPKELPATMQTGKNLSMIERVEIEAIRKALDEAKGNRSKASEILGVSRATVYRKIKAYRLD